MAREPHLEIEDFAQIGSADLRFGDLTLLVGPQATGKSLALQWLKVALDGRAIVQALRDAGHETGAAGTRLIDLVFGAGMGAAWRADTKVIFDGKALKPSTISRRGRPDGAERLFYVPAHRSMLISDGWAAPFQKLSPDTPVVARIFSQVLFDRFSRASGRDLFPVTGVLKRPYREAIDAAIFHGGSVRLEEDARQARRLRLVHGEASLPFMTWTAGQREVTPLLLGLYDLLPPGKLRKRPDIEWVVIEEPEMGLHPEAVTAILLLVLDLLWRGYRVVLSTHSPHVLAAVWMLRLLEAHRADPALLCDAFGVSADRNILEVAEAALGKRYRVYLMAFGEEGRVRSADISTLDPSDEDERVAGWGGLTGITSRFGDAVRKAVNEAGAGGR